MKSGKAIVLDAKGDVLTPCAVEKARRLLHDGDASVVQDRPLTIRLSYAVPLPPRVDPVSVSATGGRLLMHACCGPCTTYSVAHLREQGFDVDGFWYNPNVHPWQEHEQRRKSMARYAQVVSLPMIWHDQYEMPLFLHAVRDHKRFRERCTICYRMRLEKTAQVARARGYDAITTTLLISPHQDQQSIRAIGDQIAGTLGLRFYFENLRRGWPDRGRLTREHDLYRQQYCGCLYSERERYQEKPARTLAELKARG